MPFRSENQRRYLWAKHPEIAKRWIEEHGVKVQPINKEIVRRAARKKLKKFKA